MFMYNFGVMKIKNYNMFIAMRSAKKKFSFKEILQKAVKNMMTKNFKVKNYISKVSAKITIEFRYIYL